MAQQKHHKIFQTSLLNGLLQKACTYIYLNTHKAMRKSPLHTVINNWYSILYSLKILKNKVSFSIANRHKHLNLSATYQSAVVPATAVGRHLDLYVCTQNLLLLSSLNLPDAFAHSCKLLSLG